MVLRFLTSITYRMVEQTKAIIMQNYAVEGAADNETFVVQVTIGRPQKRGCEWPASFEIVQPRPLYAYFRSIKTLFLHSNVKM